MTLRDWSSLPKTLAPVYERYARWLPAAVDLVLVALIARLLAQLIWAVVPTSASAAWHAAPVQVAAPDPSSRVDLGRIASAQLFGQYQAPAKADPGVLNHAPDTQLPLTLLGILKNNKVPSHSRALIAGGSEEKPYSVSDAITQGVTLKAIFVDKVVLSRNGQLETLRLDKDAPNSDDAPIAVASTGDDSAASSLAQIRAQMLANPAKASDYIRVQPAPSPTGNGQMGYRIYPGRDHAVFTAAGLRPGDVVTSINGVQLDDPSKSLQLLSDLSQANQVSLTVQRGGETQTVNVNLNP